MASRKTYKSEAFPLPQSHSFYSSPLPDSSFLYSTVRKSCITIHDRYKLYLSIPTTSSYHFPILTTTTSSDGMAYQTPSEFNGYPTPPKLDETTEMPESSRASALQAASTALQALLPRDVDTPPIAPPTTLPIAHEPARSVLEIRPLTTWKTCLNNPERHWPQPPVGYKAPYTVPYEPGSFMEWLVTSHRRTDPSAEWFSTPETWTPESSTALVPEETRTHRSQLPDPGLLLKPSATILWADDMPDTLPESLSIDLAMYAEEICAAEERRQNEESALYMEILRARIVPNVRDVIRNHEEFIFTKAPGDRDFATKSYYMTMDYHMGRQNRPTAVNHAVRRAEVFSNSDAAARANFFAAVAAVAASAKQ